MSRNVEKYKAEQAAISQPGEIILDRSKRANFLGGKAQFTVPKKVHHQQTEREAMESMPNYWTPGKCPDRIRTSDAARIRRKMQKVDSNLDLAFNPVTERYAVFERTNAITLGWCRGWRLLFDLEPHELDNRVMAGIYLADTSKRGGARKCYEQVIEQNKRDAEATELEASDESRVWASDKWRSLQPWVGAGSVNNGNKVLTD